MNEYIIYFHNRDREITVMADYMDFPNGNQVVLSDKLFHVVFACSLNNVSIQKIEK